MSMRHKSNAKKENIQLDIGALCPYKDNLILVQAYIKLINGIINSPLHLRQTRYVTGDYNISLLVTHLSGVFRKKSHIKGEAPLKTYLKSILSLSLPQ